MGLVYFVDEMLKANGKSLKDQTVVISGSGNVAIYATEKCQQLGAKVVALSDSNGYVYDPNGIQLDIVKDIKEVKRGRIKEYADRVDSAQYTEGKGIWSSHAMLHFHAQLRTSSTRLTPKCSSRTAAMQ